MRSDEGFSECFSCENVKMQVKNSLTRVLAAVVDNAKTVVKTLLSGNFGNRFKAAGNFSGIVRCDIRRAGDMRFGNNKDVNGSLRVDIAEGKDVLVLIDLV